MLYFSPIKTVAIVLAVLVGLIAALPNLMPKDVADRWPGWIPGGQLVLGLDLQGGAHLLLQVERDDLIETRLDDIRDSLRTSLRNERIGYTGLTTVGETVQARLRDVSQSDAASAALQPIVEPIPGGLLSGGLPVTEVTLDIDSDGLIQLTFTPEGIARRVSSAVDQSIEVIRRRVDELGTTEPNIQRQGEDRVLVQVPGLGDPQRLKDLLKQTARLSFHLVSQEMSGEQALQGRPPSGAEVMFSSDDPPIPYVIERREIVSGEDLVDSQPGFDQRTNEPLVTFRFNNSGARDFGRASTDNVGRPFAIILDDVVISAPVIREPILGGSGQISGNFTVESANDLAILLRAGALPADLTIVEERTVGPGLGQDSIEAGETAGIIAAIAVLVFMVLSYGLFGVFANVALTINIIMIMGVLSMLQATLTLPGIAGIILTIGMAVDANVLIYERIREEARAGRNAIAAIDAGYKRALGTILDANITTLIAAIILFSLGSGPIRGFAITLAIGIVTTVFSAFTVNRLIVAFWVRRTRPSTVPI